MKYNLCSLVIIVVANACMPTQRVRADYSNLAVNERPSFGEATLEIELFDDARNKSSLLFSEGR